jgi:hypothetical protein
MTDSDPELAVLQEQWSPGWRITRARRSDDPPGRRTGSYLAARMDDTAGITPTLMARTAKALNIALAAQAHAVATGATFAPEPPLWP